MTSLHADEAFLGHYQFSHDPFAARVPGFKFFPAQRKPVLGQLHHLARYSQLLLVVSGPPGSGKTLLRQALVASTNKQAVHSVVVSARGAADAGGLMRQIAQGLNSPQSEAQAVLVHVAQLSLTGQEVYLLVDDAEALDDSALDALLVLAAGNAEGRAHVFLFGDSALLPRLELLADGEERFHAIELQPYSEDETREYLAQRLDGAGQGVEILSDEQIADIHQQSAGWPGAINQVARDTLIEAMLARRGAAQRAGFSFNLPKKHLLALVVVAVAVGAAWLMQGRTDSEPAAPASAQLPLGSTVAPVAEGAAPVVGSNQNGPPIEFAGSTQPLPLPLVGEAQPVIREPLAQAAGLADDEDAGAIESLTSSVSPPVTSIAPPQGTVAGTAPATPVVAPVAPPAPAAVPSQPISTAVAPAPKPVAVAPAPAPKPVAAPVKPVAKPAEKPVASASAAGGGWYRSQAGTSYALQILGTRSEGSAQAFVRQQGGEYRYFKKVHQGQPLYVVTYGSFATRNAAQAAIKALPAKVQASKPWPRSFASIQQEAQAR
ncbi:cell division protein [Pseudomonas cavernicola]|uniref:Cell division protein n=1 Tax=Pseudomonas cavernicola TaxID=2320866 RepID=A0A418XL07_9PSED|nr:AAA family ATPase [Pseudomonas cavernicola]RJG13144.1 cell division protein [Pseudomonas cavernicola]